MTKDLTACPPEAAPAVPAVTIVMPAYNAAAFLPLSLPAALAAAGGGRVLVVDPASTDDTAVIARRLGAEVLTLPRRAGPALARNRGVELVTTEVALFIDADCVAHPDVVERVRRAFAADPALVSLTGSYDDRPPDPGFFSQYMNLRHHFTHQQARADSAVFWAGCGAVRVDVFRAVGGFDAEQFPLPMIEDVELGLRLRPRGNMRLEARLQVTHLKRWTLRGVITTDLFCRAVPWTKVILRTGHLPGELNLSRNQRVAAALSPFALLGPPGAALAAARGGWALAALVLLPALLSALLQRRMIGFFRRVRGAPFALGAWLFHQVHLFYSAATLAVLTVGHVLSGPKGPPRA